MRKGAEHLLMPLPGWRVGTVAHENWRTTAWAQSQRPDPHDPKHDD